MYGTVVVVFRRLNTGSTHRKVRNGNEFGSVREYTLIEDVIDNLSYKKRM